MGRSRQRREPRQRGGFRGRSSARGVVTFGPGESEAVIRVDIQADFKPENTEQFTVQLSNPTSGVTLGTASVAATIVNDEPTPTTGTAGNDKFDKSATTVAQGFDLSQGGNDTAIGGSADDIFYMGGALTNADSITGGGGSDTLVLDGNYGSATVTFGSKTISGVENIYLSGGNNYFITLNKSNVPSGQTLRVDASAIGVLNGSNINGSSVSGSIHFLGGAGAAAFTGGKGNDRFLGGSGGDSLIGNAGDDFFSGGLGVDVMNGGAGKDTFQYNGSASESALLITGGNVDISGADTLALFKAAEDKIDLSAFHFAPGAASVLTKTAVGFTSNASGGTGFFGTSAVAIEYASKSNKSDARIYVDVNKDGNLNAGDMLIQATGVGNGAIKVSNFTF